MVLNFDFEKMSKEIFWSQYILAVILKSFKIWHGALHGGHASLWRTALRKANFIDFSAIKKYYLLLLVDKPNCKTFRVLYIIYMLKKKVI